MTATDDGPAVRAAAAGHASHGDGSGAALSARTQHAQLRMVLGLARAEAFMLARSAVVLAGLVIGAAFLWFIIHLAERPLWWSASWLIGYGQLILALTVLVAAQLAAGRARRNAMSDLYASFPATAGTRTLGFLAGLAGVVPGTLLLTGVGIAIVQALGPVGAPNATVLAAGPLLVLAAGAAGVAIGTRISHPMAGAVGALALFLSSAAAMGSGTWLVPWEFGHDQMDALPGPLAGYPPGGAHAVELAALAVLAAVVALAMTVRRGTARAGVAAAGIVAVALVGVTGVIQSRPIPAADLNHVFRAVADPASVQRCTTANQVSYCFYPGFGDLRPSLETPVSRVLAHVPARPGHRLKVMQVLSIMLPDATLTHGHPERQVKRWEAELARTPGSSQAAASPIYLPIAQWPKGGSELADAHFEVALAAAQWAVHLAPRFTAGGACVPFDQAREPIAIWLAILATHPPASELNAGINGNDTEVHNTWIATWTYPGSEYGGYIAPGGTAPTLTAVGYLLAREMTRLPAQKITRILAPSWSKWTNLRATDAQLAAALGIRLPRVAASAPVPPPGVPLQTGPQQPWCTS